MRRLLACSVVLGAALLSAACEDDRDFEFFESDLRGASEVPPVNSGATGRAGFTLDGDSIFFNVIVDDIANATVAHIHLAPAGVNAAPAVFLFGPGANFSTDDDAILAQGTLTAADMVGGATFDQLVTAMRNGGAYVNVHTTRFPAGEIRGQITPD